MIPLNYAGVVPPLRFSYSIRIFYFLIVTLVGLIVASIAMAAVMGVLQGAVALRIATVVQDLLLFVAPAVVVALLVTDRPSELLCIGRLPSLFVTMISFVALMCSIPAMNQLVEWNEGLALPDALASVEDWMRRSEAAVQSQVEMLLEGTSEAELIVNILIVAVLAGVSEELFFRGALQRLISSKPISHHAAIWVTAFLFSAFHMQFFGFFPRLLLGAFFGYLLYWSGSIWLPVAMHALNNGLVVYSSWHMRVMPEGQGVDIGSIGEGSVLVVICSVVLTGVSIYILNNTTKIRKGVMN